MVPPHAPTAVHEVALLVIHVTVAVCPTRSEVGLMLNFTVGGRVFLLAGVDGLSTETERPPLALHAPRLAMSSVSDAAREAVRRLRMIIAPIRAVRRVGCARGHSRRFPDSPEVRTCRNPELEVDRAEPLRK